MKLICCNDATILKRVPVEQERNIDFTAARSKTENKPENGNWEPIKVEGMGMPFCLQLACIALETMMIYIALHIPLYTTSAEL